jgi:hypothetical protein
VVKREGNAAIKQVKVRLRVQTTRKAVVDTPNIGTMAAIC